MANEKRLVYVTDVKDLINGLDELPWEENVDDLVNALPTVDAVILPCSVGDTVYGRWIWKDGKCFCSACKEQGEPKFVEPDGYVEEYPYCPNCGAKMDGDGNGC